VEYNIDVTEAGYESQIAAALSSLKNSMYAKAGYPMYALTIEFTECRSNGAGGLKPTAVNTRPEKRFG
jgi:hypothetical protein